MRKGKEETSSLRSQLDDALRSHALLSSTVAALELEATELRETVFELSLRLNEGADGAPRGMVYSLDSSSVGWHTSRKCQVGGNGIDQVPPSNSGLDSYGGGADDIEHGVPRASPPCSRGAGQQHNSGRRRTLREGECASVAGSGDKTSLRRPSDAAPHSLSAALPLASLTARAHAFAGASYADSLRPVPSSPGWTFEARNLQSGVGVDLSVGDFDHAEPLTSTSRRGAEGQPLRVVSEGGKRASGTGSGQSNFRAEETPRPNIAGSCAGSGGGSLSSSDERSRHKGPALRTVAELRGHQGAVYACKFSADGEWLASAGFDSKVKLWSARAGSVQQLGGSDDVGELFKLRIFSFSSNFTRCSFHFNKDVYALHCMPLCERTKKVGGELASFAGHTQLVSALAILPNDLGVVSGSYDRSVRCWDVTSGRESTRFEVGCMVQTVGVGIPPHVDNATTGSPMGQWLAAPAELDAKEQPQLSSDEDEQARLAANRSPSALKAAHRGGSTAVAAADSTSNSNSGSSSPFVIYVGTTSPHLWVCDLRSGKVVAKWAAPAPVTSIHAYYSGVGVAILGDRGNGEGIGDSSVGGSANDINTGSTCHRIMTADGSGAMLVWDARTGQILLRESVDPAQTSTQSEEVQSGAGSSGTEVSNGGFGANDSRRGVRSETSRHGSAQRRRSGALNVSCLAVSPGNSRLLRLLYDNEPFRERFHNRDMGKLRQTGLTAENERLRELLRQEGRLGVSNDEGRYAAAVCSDNSIRIVDRCFYDHAEVAAKLTEASATASSNRQAEGMPKELPELPGVLLRTKQTLRGPQLRNWPIGAAWWRGAQHGLHVGTIAWQ